MKRFVLLLLLLATSLAYSAGTCYQWSVGTSFNLSGVTWSWFSSAAGAEQEFLSACNASNTTKNTCMGISSCGNVVSGVTYTCADITASLSTSTFPTQSMQPISVVITNSLGGTSTYTRGFITLQSRVNPEGCPDCAVAGTKITSTGDYAAGIPTSKCIDSCLYTASSEITVVLGSRYATDYKSMGVSCSQNTSGNSAPAGSEAECVFGNGLVSCRDRASGTDCNSFNGDTVCTKNVQNGCIETASGIVACVKGTAPYPTGSAPNNGTAGTAATPAATQTYGDPSTAPDNQKTDVYDSTTANNSVGGGTGSNASGGSSSSSGSGGSSSSSGSGGSSSSASSGSSSSGSTCTSNCDFSQPANEEVATVAQSTTTYSSRINNAPIMQAVSGIGASLPSGTCPSGSVTLFGHSITLDIQCTLWDQIAPILSLVFLAGWAFTGLRIIMSA